MKSKLLDTNILARFVIGDVPNQQAQVNDIFNKGSDLNLNYYILPEVLIELNYVLSSHYELEKEDIIETFENILDLGFISIFDNRGLDFTKVISTFKNKNISFEDCLYLQTCLQYDLELLTFDEKLQKLFISLNR